MSEFRLVIMKIYALQSFETPEKTKYTTRFKNQITTLINLNFLSFFFAWKQIILGHYERIIL
jgi:hypothetical protein